MNDVDYGDNRFRSGDWDANFGREQTQFYYDLIIKLIPDWLKDEIYHNKFSICDLGCAEGDGTALFWRTFPESKVTGVDFSQSAIENARESFPNISFMCSDILSFDKHFDVILSSHKLEHFKNFEHVLEGILGLADKYLILFVPFREKDLHEEHFVSFDYKSFPLYINNHQLLYYREIDAKDLKSYSTIDNILLIYGNKKNVRINEFTLAELNNKHFEENNLLKERIISFEKENNELLLENTRLNKELIKNKLAFMEDNIYFTQTVNSEIENFAITKPYKLAYFIRRFKHEFIKGNNFEKKKFIKWLVNKLFKKKNSLEYHSDSNILFNILKSNKDEIKFLKEEAIAIKANNDLTSEKQNILFFSILSWNDRYQRPQHIAKNFADDRYSVYYFDADFNNLKVKQSEIESVNVIQFKQKGINNVRWLDKDNDIKNIISQVEYILSRNLIEDATIFVEFPTWEPIVSYLKEKYGYKIVFDYLDDFEGFATKNNNLKSLISRTCNLLKEKSDLIIATSEFLHDKIKNYPNTALIRNGTEVDHFLDISKYEAKNERPVIGYIGVIAYWFAFDLVQFVVKNNPDYDFVFIGDYSTVDITNLQKLPNVKFLGEKKYEELPDYLKEFDVCLIPFDPSLDLIKATNPVKFYEYLSAGKKVVATEIPELDSYHDQYILLSNESQEFSAYIRECIDGTDSLCSKEERIEFAKKHDWKERQRSISKEIDKL